MTNTNTNTTANAYWNMIKAGKSRYEAFVLIRMGGTGTYSDRPDGIRRWTSVDGSLILDINPKYSHVSCVIG
jgi:hypothetical protein